MVAERKAGPSAALGMTIFGSGVRRKKADRKKPLEIEERIYIVLRESLRQAGAQQCCGPYGRASGGDVGRHGYGLGAGWF